MADQATLVRFSTSLRAKKRERKNKKDPFYMLKVNGMGDCRAQNKSVKAAARPWWSVHTRTSRYPTLEGASCSARLNFKNACDAAGQGGGALPDARARPHRADPGA